MLRQSSPKNITCQINPINSQKTVAERYALTQYFKNTRWYVLGIYTDIQYSTVDKVISKTIILLRISH